MSDQLTPPDMARLLIDGKAPATAETYLRFYRDLCDLRGAPLHDPWITPGDVRALLGALADKKSAATVALYAAVISRVVCVGELVEELSLADAYALKKANRPMGRKAKSRAHPMTDYEASRLSAAVSKSNDPRHLRDAAILAVAARGVYRCSVPRLMLSDYFAGKPHADDVTLKTYDDTSGRRRVRVSEARALLDRWVSVRGVEPGPLFLPYGRGCAPTMRPLSQQAVFDGRRKLCGVAGVRPLTTADLRLTDPEVVRLLAEGVAL